MASATARVLVYNLESDVKCLTFSDFSIKNFGQLFHQSPLDARTFFSNIDYQDSLLEWEFPDIPPAPESPSGVGRIPDEIEDLLLLLRLYRPGELAFAALKVYKENESPLEQTPYRAISPLVPKDSSRPFLFKQADIKPWEDFASLMKSSAGWYSDWFAVARRVFLYGGGKPFNPYHKSEVDRVADYVAVLEAILVPESDFVSRRLKLRAVALLDLDEKQAALTKKMLGRFYGIRSTLVHGSVLSDEEMSWLRQPSVWQQFEQLVRNVIKAALLTIPGLEEDRRSHLRNLFDLSDDDRAKDVVEKFNAIKDPNVVKQLRKTLAGNFL